MFKSSVIDVKEAAVIAREMVHCAILPGEDGEISILEFHQPIVACLKKGVIKLDDVFTMKIKRGIARAEKNELVILVEK